MTPEQSIDDYAVRSLTVYVYNDNKIYFRKILQGSQLKSMREILSSSELKEDGLFFSTSLLSALNVKLE